MLCEISTPVKVLFFNFSEKNFKDHPSPQPKSRIFLELSFTMMGDIYSIKIFRL
tara:strand:+ start:240 stop:401 length:162 start_codon:yes stop_codon:yes gene_type:complete